MVDLLLDELLQIGLGYLGIGELMRFVPRTVMVGFVNALAILIFMAQLPELDPSKVPMLTYALVAGGLAIIYLFPRITTAIPSPLVTIVVLTLLTVAMAFMIGCVVMAIYMPMFDMLNAME